MKQVLLFLLLSSIFCNCTKQDSYITANGTITIAKYPCGPACSAYKFIIQTDTPDSTLYLPSNLPPAFRLDSARVQIRFIRTGQYPEQYDGPYCEIIDINSISSR